LGSLPVSLRLTAKVLAKHEGALALWTSAALFADGLPEDLLQQLELSGSWPQARQWLARHHVLTRRDGQWHMLPPLARYALEASLTSDAGFDWATCRGPMQSLFESAARQADSIASSIEALSARAWLMQNFGTLSRLMLHEVGVSHPDHAWLADMHNKLINHYQFQVSTARTLLTVLILKLKRPATAFEKLGDLEARLSRPDEARRLYREALVLHGKEQSGLGQANTLRSLGYLEARSGRPDEARGLYERALVIYEKEQAGLGQANTLAVMGDLEDRLGRPHQARELYDKALVLFEKLQAGLGQANTLYSQGELKAQFGRHDEARGLYDRALVLYEKEQDDLGQANTLKSLGDLEAQLDRPVEARALYDKALVLYEKEQDGVGQANALRALGVLEAQLGRPDEAHGLFDKALVLCEKAQAVLGQANTLRSMGDQLLRERQFAKAALAYRRALALYAREQDPMGMAYTCAGLARCAHGQNDLEERDTYLKNGLENATASGVDSVRRYVMAVLDEVTGGNDEAQAWLQKHMS
jgi:tetratricopeptide (TPR) repeat protein